LTVGPLAVDAERQHRARRDAAGAMLAPVPMSFQNEDTARSVPQLIDVLAPSTIATRLLDRAYTLAICGRYSAIAIVWFIPDRRFGMGDAGGALGVKPPRPSGLSRQGC
jgi:hypothetical protein